MIGIFGATISVIFVIRNVGSQKVKDNHGLANSKIEEMKNGDAVPSILSDAEAYRDNIKQCGTWFTRYTLTAAAIFGVWIFTTAFYVSFRGGCKELTQLGSNHTTNTPPADPCQAGTGSGGVDESTHHNPGVLKKTISTVLFSDWTIGLVSSAYLVLLCFAWRHLKLADNNYDEVFKMHKNFMRQREADTKDLQKTGGVTKRE
jgi:hypothetical protein